MGFKLTIIGSGAAKPTKWRGLSAQALECGQSVSLIDCGEGTQLRLDSYGVKKTRIDNVFISHLHGDHYFGLIGLLFTMHLMSRMKKLTIFAPEGLQAIVELQAKVSGSQFSYPIDFVVLKGKSSRIILDNNLIQVEAFPLKHRIVTYGFIFREKQKARNIRKDFIEEYNPTILERKAIKAGGDYSSKEHGVFPNRSITFRSQIPTSYAYCSDTVYLPTLAEKVKNINTLYHEATFGSDETVLAKERFHSTAEQAATLAQTSNVKQLLLGHISSRFGADVSSLEREAKKVFPKSRVVKDGDVYEF